VIAVYDLEVNVKDIQVRLLTSKVAVVALVFTVMLYGIPCALTPSLFFIVKSAPLESRNSIISLFEYSAA
jgi:hypothetical protein